MQVSQTTKSPFFRKVCAHSVKLSFSEGFLRDRGMWAAGVFCTLTLTRGKNLLSLGTLVQISTITKMWLSQANLCCLTGHHFAKLPWGHSLQADNPKIEYSFLARCYPAPLQRYLLEFICLSAWAWHFRKKSWKLSLLEVKACIGLKAITKQPLKKACWAPAEYLPGSLLFTFQFFLGS